MTTQEVAALIRKYAERDALSLDGTPLANAGTHFGNLYAMCDALAREVARLADRLDAIEGEL